MIYKKKILLNISEDWFFLSHFLSRALCAKKAGFEIIVCCNETTKRKIIEDHGFRFIKLPYKRSNINPIYELYILLRFIFVLKNIKPDLVHNVALKPIIHGSLASKLMNIKSVINAPVGLGYVFISNDLKAMILRPVLKFLLINLLDSHKGRNKKNKVIFENNDDLDYFIKLKAVNSKSACVISGAGVEVDKLIYKRKKSNKIPTVVLVARMLKDKGIYEFIEAFKLLKDRKIKCRFILVGDVDPINPSSIEKSFLQSCHRDKKIEWLGWRDDVEKILLRTDILCLPSYREGLPKSLVEGAAAGLPLITTDTVGCREVVIDGLNGFLVPIKDSKKLADAIEKLILDSCLRKTMGEESLKLAKGKFSKSIVNSLTMKVYNEIYF